MVKEHVYYAATPIDSYVRSMHTELCERAVFYDETISHMH